MELFLFWFTVVRYVLSRVEHWVYAWMYWIIQHKRVIFSKCIPNVCLVLYSAEYSLSDRSKRFTLYNLTYLFIPTPTRHLWKSIQLVANTTRRLFTHLFAARYFIQLSELGVVEITNSAPLWPFIVFIDRQHLQFVYDSDTAACMHHASEWSVQSKHYIMWHKVLQNPYSGLLFSWVATLNWTTFADIIVGPTFLSSVMSVW